MSTDARARLLLAALDQRCRAAATPLGIDLPGVDDSAESAALLLPSLIASAAAAPAPDVAWLVLTAVRAAMPLAEDVRDLRRRLAIGDHDIVLAELLADVLAHSRFGDLDLEMDVLAGGTVVNVDFCARYDVHTGIHRVVRETLPRWSRQHDFVATANVDGYWGLRNLAPREYARVFSYASDAPVSRAEERRYRRRLVVPWRGVLVIPEIPNHRFAPHLAAAAELSGNAVTVLGYDMIPVVSADLRPPIDAVRFAQFLTAVKHCRTVAAISVSAAQEFAGFAHAVTAQGLPGPRVREVPLPDEVPPAIVTPTSGRGGRSRVLCVGSREPHKNQAAVLHAAEVLWREGLDFELELVGGTGWRAEELQVRIDRLRSRGRRLHDRGRIDDEELWAAYRRATFSVFVSLHEGYGLPVAESLACGAPVVTTGYGSTAEIAARGGCLLVDPSEDHEIIGAMRSLLTDRALLDRLRGEAGQRSRRTWDEYADELWSVLAVGDPA